MLDQDGNVAPIELPARRAPQPIDIEELVQWAVSKSGRLPWLRVGWRELALGGGLTARPKRRPVTSWTMAEACAGITLRGRSLPAMMTTGPDAQIVLAAIQGLSDAAAAGTVLACARNRIRPDWMEGITPRRVLRPIYGYKRNHKRRGRPIMVPAWEPCSPTDIDAARAIYRAWHNALSVLLEQLQPGLLTGWIVAGLSAPAIPWIPEIKKTA